MAKVIVYGTGKTYRLFMRNICPGGVDYLCDPKFGIEKRGLRELTVSELAEFSEPATVYLCMSDLKELKEAKELLGKNPNLDIHIPVTEAFDRLSGSDLRTKGAGEYTDLFHNKLIFDETVPEKLTISFCGQGSTVKIGKNLIIASRLDIVVGTDAAVCLDDSSSFYDTHIEAAFGDIRIGKNCVFSFGTWLRNHDGHHIYDLKTGKRINYCKDIELGDHIWCGQNVTILKGVQISGESVIAASSVVTGIFPEHVVIGGNPARILRKEICWGKDATLAYNFEGKSEYYDKAYPLIPTGEIMHNQKRKDRAPHK